MQPAKTTSRREFLRAAGALAAGAAYVPLPARAQSPGPAGLLRGALIDDPRMWPYTGSEPNSIMSSVVYSHLTLYSANDYRPEGDLARAWSSSPDMRTWTFQLRPNVVWHDGQQFSAEDVKFTFDTLLDPKVVATWRSMYMGLQGVDVLDATTVRMRFDTPQPSLPALLGGFYQSIVPKHRLAGADLNNPVDFLRSPIGTGPFRLKERVPGSHLVLEANASYHLGRPKVAGLLFKIVKDGNARVAQFLANELDFVVLGPQQLPALHGRNDVTVIRAEQPRYNMLAFNCQDELFRDRRVRQALAHAIDREAILRVAGAGQGTLAAGPIARGLGKWFNPQVPRFEYSPDKAKALLAELGWKADGGGVLRKQGKSFSFGIMVDSGGSDRQQTAVLAQQFWQKIGLDVKIDTVEWNTVLKRFRATPPEYQVASLRYTHVPDPDIGGYYMTGSPANNFAYANPQVDRLFLELRATSDPEARRRTIHHLQALIVEDVPVIYLYYPFELIAVRQHVRGFPALSYLFAAAHLYKVSLDG